MSGHCQAAPLPVDAARPQRHSSDWIRRLTPLLNWLYRDIHVWLYLGMWKIPRRSRSTTLEWKCFLLVSHVFLLVVHVGGCVSEEIWIKIHATHHQASLPYMQVMMECVKPGKKKGGKLQIKSELNVGCTSTLLLQLMRGKQFLGVTWIHCCCWSIHYQWKPAGPLHYIWYNCRENITMPACFHFSRPWGCKWIIYWMQLRGKWINLGEELKAEWKVS